MRSKYKYSIVTALLFLLLFLPFVSKTIDMRLEIFPSVILPSSSGTIAIDENVKVQRFEVHGVTPNGDTLQLHKGDFLHPIPKHYFRLLTINKFGLGLFKAEQTKTSRFGIPFNIDSKVDADEIKATKVWLQHRLRKLGCADSVLIIKKRRITIAPDMTVLDRNTITHDTIYGLY